MRAKGREHAGRAGFTLVEVLAAFAITSVIMLASAALIRNVALNFDRGARTVNDSERLILAVDRLSADFGSARLVARRTDAGAAIAFMAEAANGSKPAKVMFVAAAPVASGPPGEEVVMLTVERQDEITRLVRRRAPWPGPRARFEDVTPDNPVVLIEGEWDISLVFGRLTRQRALRWHSSWLGEKTLPRFARLIVHERGSGRDRLGEADFVIRSDAPGACGRPDAAVACLAAAPAIAPADTGRGVR